MHRRDAGYSLRPGGTESQRRLRKVGAGVSVQVLYAQLHNPGSGTVWEMEAVVELVRDMVETPDKRSITGRMRLQSCVCRVLTCRITATKLAIAEGELSLNEIVLRYGFSFRVYFTHKFKQTTWYTPAGYRKRLLDSIKNALSVWQCH